MNKKLRVACYEFLNACMEKIKEKEEEGYGGWDKPELIKYLEEGLIEHTKKILTQDNLVDIANYCIFLWNLIEEKGGEIIE